VTAAPQTPAATGRLTRVTLAGPRRRADLVLPSDEPIGVLLPEIVSMVGLGPAGEPRAYQVSRLDGQVLEPTANLRAAGVADGAVLRVDPLTEAPPAAILHDVSDEMADDLARRRGRWNARARTWTATVTVTAAAALAGLMTAPQVPPGAVTAVGLVVLLGGAGVALAGRRPVGLAAVSAGAAIAMAAVPSWTADWPLRGALWTLGAAVVVLTLGLVTGNERAGALGAGSVLVLLAVWTVPLVAGLSVARTAPIMAVVSVAALGLLPRLALIISGLTRLDDRHAADEPVTRVSAEAAVDAAHRGLAVSVVATAASGAAAGWMLAQAGTPWPIVLACLLGVTLLLRLRTFPLTVEVTSLVAAAVVIVLGLVHRWTEVDPTMWAGGAAVLLGVVAIGLLVLGYDPPPHIRARARQLADRLEGLAVVALVPVAVGAFGVYARLLGTF
jgi:type VII secretion integral membrane protein EccD